MASTAENRVFASPLARRIANQNNIDLGSVNGSGPKGRIIKADIEKAMAGGGASKASASTAPAAAPKAAPAAASLEASPCRRPPVDLAARCLS